MTGFIKDGVIHCGLDPQSMVVAVNIDPRDDEIEVFN